MCCMQRAGSTLHWVTRLDNTTDVYTVHGVLGRIMLLLEWGECLPLYAAVLVAAFGP